MKINDKMIIKCNNAEEYSWLINELDKEDIFIFAIDPEHCMGKPERINGREVNWDNKSYEKWFHDRRYFSIRSDFKLVDVMYQSEAIGLKIFSPNYSIVEAKELMEEKEMKENVKYTDVYKKVVKCLVRTDVVPWENCGVIGTIPYKEGITDVSGIVLKVGDYVKVVDIRNEGSRIVTSIIVDNGNRLVPYCNKDYDGDKDILLIKVGEFPTYSHTIDPDINELSFVAMNQDEFDKQALAYYKAQYENTLSKLEVLQKKYDNSYRIQISLENTNELLKRKIEKMKAQKSSTDELSDKELTKAFINRLFGVKSAENDIKTEVNLPKIFEALESYGEHDINNEDNKGGITPYKPEDFADFNIDHGVKYPIPRESIIPPNKIVVCRTKEECRWFVKEMEKVSNDNFYKFICAYHLTSHITTGYLNAILEDPIITSVLFYFSYDTNPFKAYYYNHDEIEVYEEGSIIEASDLMKQEENKDED